jgi:hypothetical protein
MIFLLLFYDFIIPDYPYIFLSFSLKRHSGVSYNITDYRTLNLIQDITMDRII